jgi:lipopolysaccharide export system protein LptA
MRVLITALALATAILLSPSSALAQFTGQPIGVEADVFEVDDSNRTAQFSGNVIVTQPGFRMTAEIIDLTYGSDGADDIETMVATGNVVIVTDDQTAYGERADYDPNTRILILTENVKVDAAQGTVNADSMTVNLENNTSRFTASAGNRVTGIFTPSN